MTDLEAALRAVTRAVDVERASPGYYGRRAGERREQAAALAAVTDSRLLEAIEAGATAADLGRVLNVTTSRAQQRVLRARRAAGEVASLGEPEPEQVVSLKQPQRIDGAPNPWLEVPRCGAMAPPPWPVWARCVMPERHTGQHQWPPAGSTPDACVI